MDLAHGEGDGYIQRSNNGHIKPEHQPTDEARPCHLEYKGDFYSARKYKKTGKKIKENT